jgi:DNA mismatch repair protein MutS
VLPEVKLTPGMKQFKEVKKEYPDCILFFRMGDFFEMFFEDAKIASRVLGITLTKRGGAPLAGVPYYTGEENINKVVKAGYKVAVCEQLEDPKTVKNRIVKRGVVKVVTPGTITALNFLESKNNNYIVSIVPSGNPEEPDTKDSKIQFGFGIADISTGIFRVCVLHSREKVEQELARLNPAEVLIPDFAESWFRKLDQEVFANKIEQHLYSFHSSYKRLTQHFKVLNLEGYGIEQDELAVQAAGSLLSYMYDTQKGSIAHITSLSMYNPQMYMVLDRSTIRNLELFSNIRDNTERGSLISVIDYTVTSMGGRLLKSWLSHPLLDINIVHQRLNAVEELTNQTLVREEVKKLLDGVYDIERLITRISTRSANPRDLLALRGSLDQVPVIKKEISNLGTALFQKIKETRELRGIVNLIQDSINENPPNRMHEGGMIKEGFSPDLDELRSLMKDGKKFISALQEKEQERIGIPMKIGYNKIHGYYIEITKRYSDKVPDYYLRKQTLVNAERYVTPELKAKEEAILGAEEKVSKLENELYNKVVNDIAIYVKELQAVAKNLALLDVLISFSSCAVNNNYVKPEIHLGYESLIDNGRHPVIENIHPEPYVPNHTLLTPEQRLLIITGPNMAGKSSFMRQVALIHLLGQIGSFVPCSSARLGIVDRIFTRVGAYDDLTMGQSTFMVEMTETANILNNLSKRSLVIMDEIGRGTSTFDGVALAWAVAENLYSAGAKTLFATHYHQLNNLASDFEGIKNFNIAVKEKGDDIIFLRKLIEGGTDKSYGVQVAKLAGVPHNVIERAKKIQNNLETEDEISSRIRAPLKKATEKPIILEDIHIEMPGKSSKKDFSLSKFM